MSTVELLRQRRGLRDVAEAAQHIAVARIEDSNPLSSWQMVGATVECARCLTALDAALGRASNALQRRPENLNIHQAYGWACAPDLARSSYLLSISGLLTRDCIESLMSNPALSAKLPKLARLRGGIVFPLYSAPGLATGLAILRRGEVTVVNLTNSDRTGLLNVHDAPHDPAQPFVTVSDISIFCGLIDRLKRNSGLGTGLLWCHDHAVAVGLRSQALNGARLCLASIGEGVTGLIRVARESRNSADLLVADMPVDQLGLRSGEWLAGTSAESVLIDLRSNSGSWAQTAAALSESMGPADLSNFALSLGTLSDDERRQLREAGAERLSQLVSSATIVRQFTVDGRTIHEHPATGWSVVVPSGKDEPLTDFIVRFDEITLVDKVTMISGTVTTTNSVNVTFSIEEGELRRRFVDVITALLVKEGVYPTISEKYRRHLFAIAKAASNPVVREAVTRVGWDQRRGCWEFPRVVVWPLQGDRRVDLKPEAEVARTVHGVPGAFITGDKPPPLAALEALRQPTDANRAMVSLLWLCFHNLVNTRKLGLVFTDQDMYAAALHLGTQLGLVQMAAPTRSSAVENLVAQSAAHDLPVLCPTTDWAAASVRKRVFERPNVNIVGTCVSPLNAALLASFPSVVVLARTGDVPEPYVDGCEQLLPYLLSSWPRVPHTAPSVSATAEFVCRFLGLPWELLDVHTRCDHVDSHWRGVVNVLTYAMHKSRDGVMPLELNDENKYVLTHHDLVSGRLGHSLFCVIDLDLELSPVEDGHDPAIAAAVRPDSRGWTIDADWLISEVRKRYEVILSNCRDRDI